MDDLWTDGKLDHKNYEALSVREGLGHSHRKRELEAVQTAEKEARVTRTMADVDKQLAKLRAPFLDFPQVAAWQERSQEAAAWRARSRVAAAAAAAA